MINPEAAAHKKFMATVRAVILELSTVEGVEGLLDSEVHEAASEIATATNNDGVESQVEFLLRQSWKPSDILYRAGVAADIVNDDTRDEIIENAAKAFFASAWADYQDENPDGVNLSGCEIFEVMPTDIPEEATDAARRLILEVEKRVGSTIGSVFISAQKLPEQYADRECNAENFGHYLAMEAMGTGVGLESVCDRDALRLAVPNVEFTYFNLNPDDYPEHWKCPKCDVDLKEGGKALRQTYTDGAPDFPGSDKPGDCVTISPGGPGELIDVVKCPECGYSRTK